MWVERNYGTWRICERVGGRKVTLASGHLSEAAAKDAMAQLSAERGMTTVERRPIRRRSMTEAEQRKLLTLYQNCEGDGRGIRTAGADGEDLRAYMNALNVDGVIWADIGGALGLHESGAYRIAHQRRTTTPAALALSLDVLTERDARCAQLERMVRHLVVLAREHGASEQQVRAAIGAPDVTA